MSDISEQVLRAAEALLEAPADKLAASVREALQRFVSAEFTVGSAAVVDETGRTTPSYPIVVHRTAPGRGAENPVPADRVAVVIDVFEELDAIRLREAYSRIAEAKQLARTPVPKSETRTNIILGVVFAAKSSVSLDALADHIYQLDVATPHKLWLDMLVVAPIGVVNYELQFPGEALAGDFMPPAEGSFERPAPPAFYVTVVMRPTGVRSFNKLVAFIIAHLQIFAPDLADKQLNWHSILEGQPTGAITTFGFQPNPEGKLVAVPPDGYSGRFTPNKPVLLEDQRGELLGAIQLVKWQNGGVIMMAGKLPLEGMLLFLPNLKPEYLNVVRRQTHQISPVLPISQLEFNQFLSNILQRSNFRIREEAGGVLMQKFLDEGTTVPFIARCTLGLLRIRESAFADIAEREEFDKRFQNVLSSLMTARAASKGLSETWLRHRERVSSGEVAHLVGRDIRVTENVTKRLSDEFESFLNASTRAIKTGVQGLYSSLGVDIGFLFKKQSAFEAGIERLRRTDAPLADYLVEARKWTERLILLRNNLEHEIWQFPRATYSVEAGGALAIEPRISSDCVTALVGFLLDRTLCFFEEMVAHVLQLRLPEGSTITQIAQHLRAAEAPERFRITLARGGEPPWTIAYHASKFDDT